MNFNRKSIWKITASVSIVLMLLTLGVSAASACSSERSPAHCDQNSLSPNECNQAGCTGNCCDNCNGANCAGDCCDNCKEICGDHCTGNCCDNCNGVNCAGNCCDNCSDECGQTCN